MRLVRRTLRRLGRPRRLEDGWPPADRENLEALARERERIRTQHPELFAKMAEILVRIDPAGVNSETNPDEYEPEVGRIIPKLSVAIGPQGIEAVVRRELGWWFDPTPKFRRLSNCASELWGLRDPVPDRVHPSDAAH